ncbi:type I-E CRISPR-associated protein Cse1/CasA [Peptoniphilus sp. KCTC 25270]|uniref:type I-E CRISPR-associated protein Cse1/CasA n=1 Tax=Peptoniphilus sp. KCTC 25270 TaxID=2897414 RepID=UPI001E60E7E6|nr:type I-E CRISPR-associated protein Cse1/CasA [Peptoniphilus sp. KCTC 25270]MCD1147302.1 type I-E CRISPR-associated protein Cse1/CasA [Peptoniphilus sp. KCTC 25270]
MRFNLLDEPWISVITDSKGTTKEVSLLECLENAPNYLGLGGDMKTQDFAMLRLLLAVLHTVFSRFDGEGNPYEFVNLDDRFKPLEEIHSDDEEEYAEALMETWKTLWEEKQFPNIVGEYLEKWRDRFYLLHETYPFFQVTEKEVAPNKLNKSKPSSVSGKNMNRLISESGNKVALFSPKYEGKGNKEILSFPEVARWLLTFQGYSGLSDKVIFGKEKYKSSKGWIFDLGGVFVEGETLYDTLLLNLVLEHPEEMYILNEQKPCWEYEPKEIIERYMKSATVDNLAELYTNWSRGIFIPPETVEEKPFSFDIVKIPDMNHQDLFLEPMTLWRYNLNGENKDTYTPKKHTPNQALWRSFGLLMVSYGENKRIPILMKWIQGLEDTVGEYDLTIQAVSMRDDGNATSWVPVDEILDSLNINEWILSDVSKNGWVPRINDMVELTKSVIEKTFRKFVMDIKEIRNLSSSEFVNQKVEEMYFLVDSPFRDWIEGIEPENSKEEKLQEWKNILRKIVQREAEKMAMEGTSRDYVGIEKRISETRSEYKNIPLSYNSFLYFLEQELKG